MPVLRNTKVLFSNIEKMDTMKNKFSITVQLTEDQAADAEAAGVRVKTKEYDGKTQFQAQFATKFPVRVVDVAKNPIALNGSEIGRGSDVSVQYKFRDYKTPTGQQGTAQDLTAVQVLNFQEPGDTEFDDESDNFGGGMDDEL